MHGDEFLRQKFFNQKVIFEIDKICGEIEMRNDSEVHYREVKFWLDKKLTFNLLKSKIKKFKKLNKGLILYGTSIKKLKKYIGN